MSRYALIVAGHVGNVVEQDAAPTIGGQWVDVTGQHVGPGDTYAGGVFTAQQVPNTWPAFDFYRKFTAAERIAVRTLAKTDPIAEDFLRTLEAAIASTSLVHADNADVVAGLAYLSATPGGSPCLAAGRSAALLA